MEKKVIKELQKFINTPFRYKDWAVFEESKLDYMLKDFMIDRMERNPYNALWDTILWLSDHFMFSKDKQIVMMSTISVLALYNMNLKERETAIKIQS